MNNKYTKLFKNSIIFLIGNTGSQAIRFIFLLFSTHLLTPKEFGVIEIVNQTVALTLPLISIGIIEAIFRYSMDIDENKVSVFSNGIAIIFSSSILMILLTPIFQQINIIKPFVNYYIILVIVQIFQSASKQFTRGINKVLIFVLSDFINSIFLVTSGLIFVYYLKLGITGYLLSYIIAYTFDLLFLIFGAKLYKYIDIKFLSISQILKMVRYSLPLAPNNIMWWLTETSNRYIILYMLGTTMTGVYAVASKIPSLLTVFTAVFFRAWQMSAIEEFKSENKVKFYSEIFRVFWIIMVLSSSIIFVILPSFMTVFVSSQYLNAKDFIPLLTLGAIFSSLQSFIGTNYTVSKDTLGALKTSICAAFFSILLNVLLIPVFELYGAALATLLSYIFVFILRYFDTLKYVALEINWLHFCLSFTVLVAQIVFMMYFYNLSCLFSLLFFIIILIINKKYIFKIFYILNNKK